MVKQVIVWRNDLKVRKGKIAAQAAHASLAVFVNRGITVQADLNNTASLCIPLTEDMAQWLSRSSGFTKICLYCNNEEELMLLYAKAEATGLPCSMIIDSGRTEFDGIPTRTCIAIGPADSEEIDKITGNLPLL